MRVDVDEKQWFFGTEDVYGQQATEEVAANLRVETGNEERLAHGDGIGAGKHVFDVAAELAEPLLEVMLQFGRIEAALLSMAVVPLTTATVSLESGMPACSESWSSTAVRLAMSSLPDCTAYSPGALSIARSWFDWRL